MFTGSRFNNFERVDDFRCSKLLTLLVLTTRLDLHTKYRLIAEETAGHAHALRG